MPAKKEEPRSITIKAVRNLRKAIRIVHLIGSDEIDLTCHDNPLPSFYKALEALAPHVCSLCEFPGKDAEKITPMGITCREDGDNVKALVTARKKIKRGKRIFNIATPILAMWEDSENPAADHMDADAAKAVEKVISEATKYVLGDRAQGQIEFKDEDEPKEEGDKTAALPGLEGDGNPA